MLPLIARHCSRRWLWTALALLPLALLLIARHAITPPSSDDIAVQAILRDWLQGLHHQAFLPADSYLFKLPVYFAAEILPVPAFWRSLLEILFLNLISFACFIWALGRFMPLVARHRVSRVAVLLPALWLTLIGGAFGVNMLVCNYRNLELGAVFVALAHLDQFIRQPRLKRPILATLLAIVLSFFWFSDPYFLLLVAMPWIGLATGWYLVRRPRQLQLLQAAGYLMATGALSYLWRPLLYHFGIIVGGGASITTNPHELLQHIRLLLPSLGSLLGITFTSSLVRSFASVVMITAMVAGLATTVACVWWGWRQRRFTIFFLGCQPWLVAAGFVASSYTYDIGASRYLVLIPFYFAACFAIALARLRASRLRQALIIGLVVASATNLIIDIKDLVSRQLYPDQSAVYQLLDATTNLHITKGYAQYWSANQLTYLSNNHLNIAPIDCPGGVVEPLSWFTDNAQLRQPAGESFYLLQNQTAQGQACPLPVVERQLGHPDQIIQLNPSTQALIYSHDINANLPVEPIP